MFTDIMKFFLHFFSAKFLITFIKAVPLNMDLHMLILRKVIDDLITKDTFYEDLIEYMSWYADTTPDPIFEIMQYGSSLANRQR